MFSVETSNYEKLASVDVGKHIEKKNGLAYLSWAWAVDQLLRNDPSAVWSYGQPEKYGDTLMVFCSVTAFGKTMTAQLPVMDHRNKAIANPDSFAVNTAMQRCLAKAIALHGLGLYIYAGEDIPLDADAAPKQQAYITKEQATKIDALCREVHADVAKFLSYMKVGSFGEILAVDYAAAIAALEAKRGK